MHGDTRGHTTLLLLLHLPVNTVLIVASMVSALAVQVQAMQREPCQGDAAGAVPPHASLCKHKAGQHAQGTLGM